ncbi:hypothetical protein EON81_25425 [bacterium]|nr:MAG: hypothetical protein EON81_25425 [bacterium]
MTREIIAESSTRSLGTDFGYVGRLGIGREFSCVFRTITGAMAVEAISSRDRKGWTVVAISDEGGEFARLRGRNWFFDPMSGLEILLPHRVGVRVAVHPLRLLVPIGGITALVPEPFRRKLRIAKRFTGLRGRWVACGDARQDRILMVLVAFYLWLDLQRETD